MKISMDELKDCLGSMTQGESSVRQKAASSLAKYTNADWEGAPDAVTATVQALVGNGQLRTAGRADPFFRAEATKALGNIGTHSPKVVPELTRILQEDADVEVRTEAARAIGRIGAPAASVTKLLARLLSNPACGDMLRGEAARALARVDPTGASTVKALRAAVNDRSGYVCVCAAEAVAKVSPEATDEAVKALAARLSDANSRGSATQALYRIGPKAVKAVPALLIAAKDKDRLFRESVIMALRKIDPQAAAKAGL